MRLIVTGGGTGGHTSPAVAVIEELQRRDPRLAVLWVGRRSNIEQRVCANLSIPFRSVPAAGWPRGNPVWKAWVAAQLACGILRAALHIRRFRPQVVLGVGGYVSLPLVWTAQRMGVSTVLHEQNKRLGKANQLCAARANRILLSYPDTLGNYPKERMRLVGNPVRAAFRNPPNKQAARQTLGLDPNVPVLLVTGGSQGARTLNRATADALVHFRPGELQVYWIAGPAEAQAARRAAANPPIRVVAQGFVDDMATVCAAADIIVSRAGASSTAEIAVLGKPAVLVPYPFAADNHQEQNARAFEAAGAAIVITDAEFTGERLVREIRRLFQDPPRLDAMARAAGSLAMPCAAENIAEEILELAFVSAGGNNTSIP